MDEADRPRDVTRTEVEGTQVLDDGLGGVWRDPDADFQRQQLARHGRFDVGVRLGSGSYGAVFEAYDRTRNATVALKTLVRASAESQYRFKREFRSLTDLHHPNLVSLHELFADEDLWWFTMELIDGVPFDEWVVAGAHAPRSSGDSSGADRPSRTIDTGEVGPDPATASDHTPAMFDEERLRAVLSQLVRGISALHATGRLHRDIKPSNVLVDGSGRVVVLDFGLVTETTGLEAESTSEVAGTPAYMAPEQGLGDQLDESCDWYALGILLYRCLTGRLPFEGSARQVLRDKLTQAPPDPRDLDPALPADLCELAVQLMSPEPSGRPGGEELRKRFQVRGSDPGPQRDIFVGREAELAVLERALDTVAAGGTAVVHLSGPSGVGKSSLARRFLQGASTRHPGLLVLPGRCFVEESVPYKALDSVVDALSRHLNTLPADRIARLLPDDASPLLRVFPILNRVLGRKARRPEAEPGVDPEALRRRAFAALRELLANVARRRLTIISIDDLQWGDMDSVEPLRTLLRPPDSPPVLLLSTHRSEEEVSSPILQAVLPESPAGPLHPRTERLSLGPLESEEAEALAHALLFEQGRDDADRAEAIARNSGGSPFFLAQLASAGGSDAAHQSLEAVVASRLSVLEPEDRKLLEVLSVAGRPLPRREAMQAAGVENGPLVVKRLRGQRLIRNTTDSRTERLFTYHDRIREVTDSLIDEARRARIHGALAEVLDGSRHVEPEELAVHYFGCGQDERGLACLRAAAESALANLAFARAAELFEQVLERGEWNRNERRTLRIELARALSSSGRGELAAEHYMRASLGAERLDSLELRTLAAGCWLRSGRVEEGLRTARALFADLDLPLPSDRIRAVAQLASLRARLAFRGLDAQLRPREQVDRLAHVQALACRSLAPPLGLFDDPVVAASVLAKGLQIALDSGDPVELSRALCAEANFTASSRGDEERTLELLGRAREGLATVPDDKLLELAIRAGEGVSQVFLGNPGKAADKLLQTERWARTRCPWGVFIGQSVRHYGLLSFGDAGRYADAIKYGERWWRDALEREDRVGASLIQVAARGFPRLAIDDPEGALERADMVRSLWNARPFPQLAWYLEVLPVRVALYRGESAHLDFERAWSRLAPIGLHRWGYYGIERLDLEGQVYGRELARGGHGRGRRRELRRRVAAASRGLARKRQDTARARGLLHEALLAADAGQDERAAGALERARDLFERRGALGLAAAADHRRGRIIGGDTGDRLCADAERRLAARGVEHPARFVAMLYPFA